MHMFFNNCLLSMPVTGVAVTISILAALFSFASLSIQYSWRNRCEQGISAAEFVPKDGEMPQCVKCELIDKYDVSSKANPLTCLMGKKILMLGDSQTFHLSQTLVTFAEPCKVLKKGGRCNEGSAYMGLPTDSITSDRARIILDELLVHGNGTGPVLNGKKNPQCRDCSGCNAFKKQCANGVTVEFIGIEFARDFETITDLFNTSQENMIEYVLRSDQPPDIIFFNTGLHDLVTDEKTYEVALEWYTDLFRTRLSNVPLVWMITTAPDVSATPDTYEAVTSAINTKRFNEIACSIMLKNRIPCIDFFATSLLGKPLGWYSDNVHLKNGDGMYYKVAVSQLLHKMCRVLNIAGDLYM